MSQSQSKDPGGERVSKTRMKQQMAELQDLGSELVELSSGTLKQMELPEDLLAAVLECKRLTAHGAIARQKQYIGRLMRDVDPEPIQKRLAVMRGESAEHTGWLHLLERWRERLMEDDALLASFVADHPGADVQQLRTMIRNARKEKQDNKPPKSYRALFQALKELIPEPGQPRYTEAAAREDEE